MSRRLVCIEDDPEVIELMRLIVTRYGFEFYDASSGLQGIELVEDVMPDLVLLDLMMPGSVDGWDVFDHLKNNAETKDIAIIVVTARAYFDERVAEMRSANGGNLVTKPFGPAQLMDAINRALNVPSDEI